jgi:hypothetical protein
MMPMFMTPPPEAPITDSLAGAPEAEAGSPSVRRTLGSTSGRTTSEVIELEPSITSSLALRTLPPARLALLWRMDVEPRSISDAPAAL